MSADEAQVGQRLLTMRQAAEQLGTTERHVRKLWATRRLPAIKVGALVRFDPADLDRWIDAHRVEAIR